MKMAFLLLLLHFWIFFSCSTEVNSDANGVCISKRGKFPPYVIEGKLPRSAIRQFKDLNLCKVFQRKTCCSASQMKPVSLALESLATYGEANKNCLELFELLECSICEPDVGIQSGPLRICPSFCDRVYKACSNAYFSTTAGEEIRAPCGVNKDITCGKASYLEPNGTAFCNAVGFNVQTAFDSIREPCYGIEGSLEELMESVEPSEITMSFQWFLQQNLKQFIKMPLYQKIGWILTGAALNVLYHHRWQMEQEVRELVQMNAIRLEEYFDQNMNGNMNGNINGNRNVHD